MREGLNITESRTPEVENNHVKDEMTVTFFDKSLVEKRISQEEVLRDEQPFFQNIRPAPSPQIIEDEDGVLEPQ